MADERGIMKLEEKLVPKELDYFARLFETLNYSLAAKSIPMSYQGFKKSIRLLERNLSVELFAENARGNLTPTAYADKLYEVVCHHRSDVEQLEKEYAELGLDVRPYILPAANGAISSLGNTIVDDFHHLHPDIGLDIAEAPDATIDAMLASGECDKAIVCATDAGVNSIPLVKSDLCIWVNCDDELSRKQAASIEDLAGRDIMLPDKHFKHSGIIVDALQQWGIKPKSMQFSGSILESFSFALTGKGIGIGMMDAARLLGGAREVRAVPLEGFTFELSFAYKKNYALSKDDHIVLDYLKRIAKRRLAQA